MKSKDLLQFLVFVEVLCPIPMTYGLFIDKYVWLSHKFILSGVLWLIFGFIIWITFAIYEDLEKAIREG